MKPAFLLSGLALLLALVIVPDAARCEDKPPTQEGLRQELLERVKEDQEARTKWLESMNKMRERDPKNPALGTLAEIKKMQEIDRRNTAWLKGIINKHGWPGKTLVGEDGANAAWLLVQHADLDRPFQKRCLTLLTVAVKKGEATAQEQAYLTDRLLVAEGKKQKYGTQFRTVGGKTEPNPIEDEANVDKRRKELGLPSMAEYRLMIEKLEKSPQQPSK
jgi:hypothetical protein